MSSNSQGVGNQGAAKKKKNKGSFALGLVSQAGTAAKKAWEQGTIVRTPRELFTQYNVRRKFPISISPKRDELHSNNFSSQPLDNTELYSYSALPTPTSIRLLEVGAHNAGELIQCRLHIVDLRHNPRYIALSYSWERDASWTNFAAGAGGRLLGAAFRHVGGVGIPKSKDADADTDTSTTSKRVMMCDGKKMIIKPNLYDALLQIRQTAPGNYWIDAVCMNQKDDVEKTQQIRMSMSSRNKGRTWISRIVDISQ